MKLKSFILSLALLASASLFAKNEKQTVTQVTSAVELTTDVDYVITGTEPFATAGSVNIVNTEHAVVIIQKIRPSKVITSQLNGKVFINGVQAKDGVNCQVKMYGSGAIILPYSKDIKPLTVFSEQNFGGTAVNDFGLEHSGGFMNTLTTAKLNNQIRSFKLKRGYMVTFAIGQSGWGYSRCFIADQEDLEIATLPEILDQKISSYRLFQWQNFNKKGVHDESIEANAALGTNWCFGWAAGYNMLPDVENVPHHIYEDWPSASACGSATWSCHMQTNNEPGNDKDDHPQDVATVLNNWENLMRTGMRLCSESSHDGSMGHLKACIDSIDARGWRCDILDLHCYWASGTFNNLTWYSNEYGKGRPIWISEWVWGASWNNNGAWAAGQTDEATYNGTVPILNVLNNNDRVERYAYWNSEAWFTKIWRDDKLTKLGEYYAKMETEIGFRPEQQFIPRVTRIEAPSNFKSTNASGYTKLEWDDPNGELTTRIEVQAKAADATSFTTVGTVTPRDKSAKFNHYVYNFRADEPGSYTLRVKVTTYNNKTFYTPTAVVNIDPAQGTDAVQFGRLNIQNLNSNEITYSEAFPRGSTPEVFIGAITNNNTDLRFGNITAATSSNTKFTYQPKQWSGNTTSMSKSEEIPFFAMPAGNYKFGELDCEIGNVKAAKATSNAYTDTTVVAFTQPFAEGVTPVVITEIKKPSYTSVSTLGVRVFDVTNEGFKFIVYSEDATSQKITLQQNVAYLAITPGFDCIDAENEILIAAGHGTDSNIYGTGTQSNTFYNGEDVLYLYNPTILAALQTNNYPTLMMLRRANNTETIDDVKFTNGIKIVRRPDHTYVTPDGTSVPQRTSDAAYQDQLGWVAIAFAREGGSVPTAIHQVCAQQKADSISVRVVDGRIYVDGVADFQVYTTSGAAVNARATQLPGTYVVKIGKQSVKVLVK